MNFLRDLAEAVATGIETNEDGEDVVVEKEAETRGEKEVVTADDHDVVHGIAMDDQVSLIIVIDSRDFLMGSSAASC